MSDTQKTPAERLDALLAKHAPAALEFHAKHKVWPGADADLTPGEDHPAPATIIDAHKKKLMVNDKLSEKDAAERARAADSARRTAPYQIITRPSGKIRIVLTKDDGSAITGNGATVEEAVAALEAL